MIVDQIEFLNTYGSSDVWRQICEALKPLNTSTEAGSYELYGRDLFFNVDEYETKHVEHAVLETHEKYIDIQYMLEGEEYIDVYPAAGLKVEVPYSDEKDVQFYELPHDIDPIRIKLTPGRFAVFYQQDAHMPQLVVESEAAVKKVVVKIKASLLD